MRIDKRALLRLGSSTTNENTGNTKTVNNHDTAAVACDAKLSERSTYTATQLRAACLARLSSHIAPAAGATKYRFIDGLCYGADWIVYEGNQDIWSFTTASNVCLSLSAYIYDVWYCTHQTTRVLHTVRILFLLWIKKATYDQHGLLERIAWRQQ